MIDTRFFRAAAVCSMLSAITTLLLIFLPEFFASAQGFEARMARVHEFPYQLRASAYLLHPFLVLTAALGVMFAIRRDAPVLALAGLLGFFAWAFTEASQQTLTLFAFDRWRLAWETADEATRAAIRVNALMYDGIWDGMYMLLLIAFAIGNACYGAALVRGQGLTRVVGGFLFAAALLTVCLFMNELKLNGLNLAVLPAAVLDWSYPAIQPLGRFLIGVWLWREAKPIER